MAEFTPPAEKRTMPPSVKRGKFTGPTADALTDGARETHAQRGEARSASGGDVAELPAVFDRRLRVAFLSNDYLSSESVRSWSGLPFHMRLAIEEAGIEVVPIKVKDLWGGLSWFKFAYWRLLRNRRYLRSLETALLRSYGRQIERRLAKISVDAVLSPSTWMIAHLQTSLPVLLWTDATFANVLNFYQAFSNLAPPSVRQGHATEQAALDRCSVAFFSSEWAARSAVGDYGLASDRVEVLAFGANIEKGVQEAELDAVIAARPADRWRLLFIGVDWERKGAGLAVEIVHCLRARGLTVDLTIVGCQAPANASLPSGVEVTGFISKATAEGRQRIDELCRQSHLFIMPTRADCTPCVYGEANSYALPCVGTDVGGVGSVIVADVNGRVFPLEASAEEYADYIAELMGNRSRYEELCRTAWGESQNRLSWRQSAGRIKTRLELLCDTGKGAAE
jgi:glycosyltransferase involved in cell wall biosynthesis